MKKTDLDKSITIRVERHDDHEKIAQVVRNAFAGAEHTDGTEWQLVSRLRYSEDYIPGLSLVAEINGLVVGHIMMTRLRIADKIGLALAPLSVAPEYQKNGIGGMLVEAAHAEAAKLGYHYSVVLGDDRYYSRFGYRQASEFGILPPFDVESRFFMAKKLSDSESFDNSVVKYAPEFMM
mgnify:CR=1 FL=1